MSPLFLYTVRKKLCHTQLPCTRNNAGVSLQTGGYLKTSCTDSPISSCQDRSSPSLVLQAFPLRNGKVRVIYLPVLFLITLPLNLPPLFGHGIC